MKIIDGGYLFSEDEMKRVKKIEVNGENKYFLPKLREWKNGLIVGKQELIDAVKNSSTKKEATEKLNVSYYILDTSMLKHFNTKNISEVAEIIKADEIAMAINIGIEGAQQC